MAPLLFKKIYIQSVFKNVRPIFLPNLNGSLKTLLLILLENPVKNIQMEPIAYNNSNIAFFRKKLFLIYY